MEGCLRVETGREGLVLALTNWVSSMESFGVCTAGDGRVLRLRLLACLVKFGVHFFDII